MGSHRSSDCGRAPAAGAEDRSAYNASWCQSTGCHHTEDKQCKSYRKEIDVFHDSFHDGARSERFMLWLDVVASLQQRAGDSTIRRQVEARQREE